MVSIVGLLSKIRNKSVYLKSEMFNVYTGEMDEFDFVVDFFFSYSNYIHCFLKLVNNEYI